MQTDKKARAARRKRTRRVWTAALAFFALAFAAAAFLCRAQICAIPLALGCLACLYGSYRHLRGAKRRAKLPMWIALGCAAASVLLGALFVTVGGRVCFVGATEADISGGGDMRGVQRLTRLTTLAARDMGDADVSALSALPGLESLDLRGSSISRADFTTLRAALPSADILWSVPVGTRALDSDSAEITLLSDELADMKASLSDFPNLTLLDFTACDAAPADADEIKAQCPNLRLVWNAPVRGQHFRTDSASIAVPGAGETSELLAELAYFDRLTSLDVRACGYTLSQLETLAGALPGVALGFTLDLSGAAFDSDSAQIDLSDRDANADEVSRALALAPAARAVDLSGSGLSLSDMNALAARYPDVRFDWSFTLCGANVSTKDETLDLSGRAVNADELLAGLPLLANLKRVDLSDSGLSNEFLASLREIYPNTAFVWKVYVGEIAVSTDAAVFATGHDSAVGVSYTSEDARVLAYCTDLKALDLAFNNITDISFLAGLTELRALNLAGNRIEDISPLSTLANLSFLDLHANMIKDTAPIAGLSALTHVNLCENHVFDISPLLTLTGLQKLWISNNRFGTSDQATLEDALPDCLFQFGTAGALSELWTGDALYQSVEKAFSTGTYE